MSVRIARANSAREPRRLTLSLELLRRIVYASVVACLVTVAANAQSAATADILRRAFLNQEFAVKSFGPVRWLDGGRAYTTLEASALAPSAKGASDAGEAAVDLVRYNTVTAQREVLIPAQQLTPPDGKKPITIEDYSWSVDMNRVLIFTNSKRVWRENTRGDYWVFDRKSAALRKLGERRAAFDTDVCKVLT